jgi:iron(III) transport system substrate-binding protein
MFKAIHCLVLFCVFFTEASFAKKNVVVYTARKEHLVKDLFKQFEKETGIRVDYHTGKSPVLIQQLKSQKSNVKADIFMTVDAGNLWHAKRQGLLSSVESDVLKKNIPGHLRDRENSWFGLSLRARTIVFNNKELKKSDLVSYEDLADKKWKGKLCLRTSKKVYNQSLVAMLISQWGFAKAKDIVKGWVSNVAEIYPNDTSVLKAIASGQCQVGIVNTYYLGRLLKKDSTLPLQVFWPNQKSYGVHVNISGAGLVKGAPHKQEAIELLNWLASKNAQQYYAQVNMEYAVLSGAPVASEVKSWGEFKSNEKFHLSDAGKLQKLAIKLMKEVGYK